MMATTIPRKFIDDLLTRVDIVEVIGSRMELKKAGANYSGLCPFHSEKTPSFTVSASKQFYYCFGCGAHGDAISFLVNFDRMEFVDAIETLATQAGLTVPRTENNSVAAQSSKSLYQLLDKVNKYYQQQLRTNQAAITYLKQRGLTGEICQRYGVGYAPAGWNNLADNFGSSVQIERDLIASGLIIQNEKNRSYDRFRNRITFPIRDQRGRVLGFGGRTLSATDTAKYLNSPETTIFHKGSELYGLFEAKQNSNTLPALFVVEGYMDVIALAQYGIENVVATLGTATTSKHVQKLLRYTPKIIFCFDGDSAGKKAAWRALENTLPLMRDGTQALFLFLPRGEDPDSFIRKQGKESFLHSAEEAIPLSEFLFSHLSHGVNINSVAGRANLAQLVSTQLKRMPKGVFRQLMFEKLAKIVKMEVSQLQQLQPQPTPTQQMPAKTILHEPHSLVRIALKLLLHAPALAEHVSNPKQLAEIEIPQIQLLLKLLERFKQEPQLTTGALLNQWQEETESTIIAKLSAQEIIIPQEHLQSEFIGTIQRLYEQGREQTIQKLLTRARHGQLNDKERYRLQKLIKDAKIEITR